MTASMGTSVTLVDGRLCRSRSNFAYLRKDVETRALATLFQRCVIWRSLPHCVWNSSSFTPLGFQPSSSLGKTLVLEYDASPLNTHAWQWSRQEVSQPHRLQQNGIPVKQLLSVNQDKVTLIVKSPLCPSLVCRWHNCTGSLNWYNKRFPLAFT